MALLLSALAATLAVGLPLAVALLEGVAGGSRHWLTLVVAALATLALWTLLLRVWVRPWRLLRDAVAHGADGGGDGSSSHNYRRSPAGEMTVHRHGDFPGEDIVKRAEIDRDMADLALRFARLAQQHGSQYGTFMWSNLESKIGQLVSPRAITPDRSYKVSIWVWAPLLVEIKCAVDRLWADAELEDQRAKIIDTFALKEKPTFDLNPSPDTAIVLREMLVNGNVRREMGWHHELAKIFMLAPIEVLGEASQC